MDTRQDALVLQVEGMECERCEKRVVNVLRRLEGVRGAVADHATGRVWVDLIGDGVEPRVLAERIDLAGYRLIATETRAEAAPAAGATPRGDTQ